MTVIVLSYNGVDLTLNCLSSLREQTYPATSVLVVDNGSQDGTVEAVRAAYPEVRLLASRRNLGYAAGNNAGLRAALRDGADLMFLINNDTLLAPDCISALVSAVKRHPDAGMLGPMVYTWDGNGTIFSAGGCVDWHNANAVNEGAGEPDHGQYQDRPVDFINGCGLLVTRTAVERAGLLDPNYFMYWEETDWCQRVRKAGLEVWFVPDARMQHMATLRSEELGPTTLYYMTRNRVLFFARHTPLPARPRVLARALHGALLGVAANRRARRPAHARAMQTAIVHALLNRWGQADPGLWLAPGRQGGS